MIPSIIFGAFLMLFSMAVIARRVMDRTRVDEDDTDYTDPFFR
jgi:hypothetical protein